MKLYDLSEGDLKARQRGPSPPNLTVVSLPGKRSVGPPSLFLLLRCSRFELSSSSSAASSSYAETVASSVPSMLPVFRNFRSGSMLMCWSLWSMSAVSPDEMMVRISFMVSLSFCPLSGSTETRRLSEAERTIKRQPHVSMPHSPHGGVFYIFENFSTLRKRSE